MTSLRNSSWKNTYAVYLYYLTILSPLERAILLLNLQKAHYHYSLQTKSKLSSTVTFLQGDNDADEDNAELAPVIDMIKACRMWNLVENKDKLAQQEWNEWGHPQPPPQGTTATTTAAERSDFKIVQINGLSYVAQIDHTAMPRPPLAVLQSFHRTKVIKEILTMMMRLLITYTPTAPAIAYGRTSSTSLAPAHWPFGPTALQPPVIPIPGAADILPGRRDHPPGGGGAIAAAAAAARRRRRTFSIIINVSAVLAIAIPLSLLAMKLTFLVWIFGRHASFVKKSFMIGFAVAYILWEGVTLYQRRVGGGAGVERMRRRVAVGRREAQGNGDEDGPQEEEEEEQGVRGVGGGGVADEGGRIGEGGGGIRLRRVRPVVNPLVPPPPPPHPPHPIDPAVAAPFVANGGIPARLHRPRRIISPFSPRYWINRIAAVGLASEAIELGLVPRTISGHRIPPPLTPHVFASANDRIGLAREARSRAARNIAVAIVLFVGTLIPAVEKKRKRALEKREILLITRREGRVRREVARREAEVVAAAAAAVVVVPDDVAANVATGEPTTTTTTGVPPPTNEELFADGMGEPDQDPVVDRRHLGVVDAVALGAAAAAGGGGGGGGGGSGESDDNSASEEEDRGEREEENEARERERERERRGVMEQVAALF